MAQNLLAKTKLKKLDQSVLRALALQSDAEGEGFLVQSHYTITGLLEQSHRNLAGSLDEQICKIRVAFGKWKQNQQDYTHRWCYVLGVFDDAVVAYNEDYYSGGYEYGYIRVPFTVSGEEITFGEVEEVNVKMVVEALGVQEANNTVSLQGKETQDAELEQGEKPGLGERIIPLDADVALSNEGVTPTNGETEANKGQVSVPDLTAATLGEGGGLSDANPAGANPNAVASADALIDSEKNKTEAGLKQSDEATPEGGLLLQANESLPLVQGISVAKTGEHFGTFEQSGTEGEGDKKHLCFQGVITVGNVVNSQGQNYPTSVWERNLPNMNRLAQAGKFLGRLEHKKEDGGLTTTAVKFDQFWQDEKDPNKFWGKGKVVPTIPDGLNLQAMIEAGVVPDFSTVGYGSQKQSKLNGEDVMEIQSDFVCTRVDVVMNASSPGSTMTETFVQSQETQEEEMKTLEQGGDAISTTPTAAQRIASLAQSHDIDKARAQMLAQAKDKLNAQGIQLLQGALDKEDTAEGLLSTHEQSMKLIGELFAAVATPDAQEQSETYSPKFFQGKDGESAPKTVGALFDRLTDGLPDEWAHSQSNIRKDLPSHLKSPKAACKKLMENTARMEQGAFNGRSAALSLLALEQGKVGKAQDILEQSLDSGATIHDGYANPGGAPVSSPFIFPLIRAVFPMLIMNEIASIQTLDRPLGKIFFLEAQRANDPTEGTDKPMHINTSANPFNSSFADSDEEGDEPAMIKLSLSNIDVEAENKKLRAQWSIEEMQDLRAYHGLDVATELMTHLAREIAIEWNMLCLNDMLSGATGGAREFGGKAPSGWEQKDWDAYIFNYLAALDNDVFEKRNGGITHLVVGTQAALALGKTLKFAVDPNGDPKGLETFPGAEFFPVGTSPSGARYRIIKTNLWTGANRYKMLAIRRGGGWADTPYIFAPYASYITPMFTNPKDFSQQQGIMDRAARRTVIGDSMATLTVNPAGTGVPI